MGDGFACTAPAQSYPNKPIRVSIPFPPGEAAEFYAEFIKSEYAKYGKIVRDIGLQPQ